MDETDRDAAGGPSEGRRVEATARWGAAALLIVTLLLVANYPLLTGRAAPVWDARTQFAP